MKTGEQRRDDGIAQVKSHNEDWHADALHEICFRWVMRSNTGEITSNEIRDIILAKVGEPKHPNAWGSLIRTAVRKGYLEETGEWRKSETPESHARRVPVYRWR